MICRQTASRSRSNRSMTNSPCPEPGWFAMRARYSLPRGRGGPVNDPHVRASDADRERVAAALERHVAAGRLSLDEYAQRLSLVLRAVTHGELTALTDDLPRDESTGFQHRQLALAFLVAALALVVLGVILAVGR